MQIDWKKIKGSLLMGMRQALVISNMKEHIVRSEEIIWNCIKDEELSAWNSLKLIYGVISLLTMDPEYRSDQTECINLIKLI